MKVKLLSRVRLIATPWTAAYQAPLYTNAENVSLAALGSPKLGDAEPPRGQCVHCSWTAELEPPTPTAVLIPTFQPSLHRLQRKQTLLTDCQDSLFTEQGVRWGSGVPVMQNLGRHSLSPLSSTYRLGPESERKVKVLSHSVVSDSL